MNGSAFSADEAFLAPVTVDTEFATLLGFVVVDPEPELEADPFVVDTLPDPETLPEPIARPVSSICG